MKQTEETAATGHHSITIILPGGRETEVVQVPVGFEKSEHAVESMIEAMREAVQKAYNLGRESHFEELEMFMQDQRETMGSDVASRRYVDRFGKASKWSKSK